jgi:hypothetical protein
MRNVVLSTAVVSLGLVLLVRGISPGIGWALLILGVAMLGFGPPRDNDGKRSAVRR